MRQKSGAKEPNERVLYGVLGVILLGCVGYIYYTFAGTGGSAPPPPAPVANTASVLTNSPAPVTVQRSSVSGPVPGMKQNAVLKAGLLDPTLHMESMEVTEGLEYSGLGRNIFSGESAPPPQRPIPAAIANGRPGPMAAPVPSGPVGPPPPAPINLKFFGTETSSKGKKKAFLLEGDDVYTAVEGEIVGRRYKVISIGTNSVVEEDMPNNNRQTLPMELQ